MGIGWKATAGHFLDGQLPAASHGLQRVDPTDFGDPQINHHGDMVKYIYNYFMDCNKMYCSWSTLVAEWLRNHSVLDLSPAGDF